MQADLARYALSGTTASELVIADNTRINTGSGSIRLSFPGVHMGNFSVTRSNFGAYLQSDGDSLYANNGTLIKLSSDVMDGVDWSRYQEIDTDAFDSMSQYWNLNSSIPDSLKQDKVFHFCLF